MKSIEFSFRTRQEAMSRLPDSEWELVIIGGGASGAACARDAALRGISTLLVEAEDFASGTSSGSSKLIHGGVRYLEQKEFSLVYHAIRERERLKDLYYPLVRDIDFIFPTYKNIFPPKWLLNLGLYLYDSFSFFQKRHQSLSKEQMTRSLPFLKQEGLTGGLIYQDSFTEDYRLVTELIKSAHRHGATCLSRLEVKGIHTATPFELSLQDHLSGQEFKVKSKLVLNCAGPFSDEIKNLLQLPSRLHLTQGVHFVFPKSSLPIEKALVLSDPENKRILFAIPWDDVTYLGTTDTTLNEPRKAKATAEDLEYVLSVAKKYLNVELDKRELIQSWAAVRPLLKPDSAELNSDISREHHIEEKPASFFHLLGGKLTSHRLMAEEAIDLICKALGRNEKTLTDKTPLQDRLASVDPNDRLDKTYGLFSDDVLELDKNLSLQGKRISRKLPHLCAEVYYAIHHEMALEPLDFLRRRSSVYYESSSIEIAEAVIEIFKQELKLTNEEVERLSLKTFESYKRDREAFSQ